MKTWDNLTRAERRVAMKNYRAEWIRDCGAEIISTPTGWEREELKGIMRNLERTESPQIVYDALVDISDLEHYIASEI